MKIVSTLKKYGVIQEMNDWKKHYSEGNDEIPKVEQEILDTVEDLIKEVIPLDSNKVKNFELAPWIIKFFIEKKSTKITDEEKDKLLTVIGWFKDLKNDSEVKNLNLDQVFELAKKNLETKKSNLSNTKFVLPAENEGKIRRVYEVNDGSGRIWVEVLNGDWLTESQDLNPNRKWAVMCQVGSDFTNSSNQNIQLIGPPKENINGPWSTQIGMSGVKAKKNLREIKQEGNAQPGTQSTAAGYSDGDERIVDFLCNSDFAKNNILELSDYGNQLPNRNAGGAGRFLIQIIEKKPELFNKLADHRDDLIEKHKDLILELKGEEWFLERQIDINTLAETDPIKFLDKFEKLINRFGNVAVEQLQKINILDIYKKEPDLILKNIHIFIGRIPSQEFANIFKSIDINKFARNYTESFKNVIKFISNHKNDKIYKEIFEFLLDKNLELTLDTFGVDLKFYSKIFNLMKFLETPRMREHQNAVFDAKKNIYIGERKKALVDANGEPIRDAQNRVVYGKENFTIPDDKKILDIKERKKFLLKNKEYIKSKLIGGEEDKEIQFLRLLTPQLSEQEAKSFLISTTDGASMRDKIINNINKKYDEFIQDKNTLTSSEFNKKYGLGIDPVTQQMRYKYNQPGILQFYKTFKFAKKNDNMIPLADLLANKVKLVYYYYLNSKLTKNNQIVDALYKYLQLMQENNVAQEEMIKILRKDVESVLAKKNYNLASSMLNKCLNLVNRKIAINELKYFKDKFPSEYDKDYTLRHIYKELYNEFAIKKFLVNPGERIEYKDYESRNSNVKYNLLSGKRYLVIDVKNIYNTLLKDDNNEVIDTIDNVEVINGEVLVTEESEIENGGLNIWVPTSLFKVKEEMITELGINENFEIFENKFLKIKKLLSSFK